MTVVWVVVAATGAATFLLKAAGPALVGRRALPAFALRLLSLLAPALLAALVVTQVFADGRRLTVDARAAGLAAAGLAIRLRAPVLAAVAVAAVTTGLARALA